MSLDLDLPGDLRTAVDLAVLAMHSYLTRDDSITGNLGTIVDLGLVQEFHGL